MTGEAPLDCRVLSVARGVAGAYALRLLADLGARCAQIDWQPDRPGDWPPSPAFRRYFTHLVDVVEKRGTVEGIRDRLAALAPHFDLIITDFSAAELPADESLYLRLRPFNSRIVVANVDHFGRTGPYAAWTGDEYTDYALGGWVDLVLQRVVDVLMAFPASS